MGLLAVGQLDREPINDVDKVASIVAEFVERHAPVAITTGGSGLVASHSGFVVGHDSTHLAVELRDANECAVASTSTALLCVRARFDGVDYTFETRADRRPEERGSVVVYLRKPTHVFVAERRRSPRRGFRRKTEVVFRDPDTGVAASKPGLLLNLSRDGIACRLDESDCSTLDVGHSILVGFDLGESVPFELPAQVVNVTRGGTTGCLVVGLEFRAEEGCDASRAKLQKALELTEWHPS